MSSQKIIITEIQNPKFFSNVKPVVTVQKHIKNAKQSNQTVNIPQKTGRAQSEGTIRDYLIEHQYEKTDPEIENDPDPFRTKPRPRAKFSFHPEFNAHFAIRDRVKVKRRSDDDMTDIQWFGGKLPINRSEREVFFPHSNQELEVGIISTEAIIKKRSASGAPMSQRVNIVYEDPQIAAMTLHEARVREEEEKLAKVQEFRDKVKERVIKLQKEEKDRQKASLRKSPTAQEKMKLFSEKIYKGNLKRYEKELQKRQDEQDKAKKYKELIEQQQENARKQQLLQMEQEVYASKLPDPHTHQFPSRPDLGRASRGSIGTVSKRSVLHSARGDSHTEGDQTARSIPLSARSGDIDDNNEIPKLPLKSDDEERYEKYVSERDQAILEEDRYIEALRLQLISKVKQKNITLPALCGCGLDPFDNHPLKCCNNCEFYRNPAAYVRQLESLLFSFGVTL